MAADALFSKKETILHPEEKKHYLLLKSKHRQAQFLLGRYCAKSCLSNTLANYPDLHIGNGVFGQPILIAPKTHLNRHIGISHSKKVGVAISFPHTHPIGIDIEEIRTRKSTLMVIKKKLSEQEKALLTHNEATILTQIWSAKEAMAKCLFLGVLSAFSLLKISSITKTNTGYEIRFENLAQYKCISIILDNYILSIALPRNTTFPEKWLPSLPR